MSTDPFYFTYNQNQAIASFHIYVQEMPIFYCAFCCCMLYEDETALIPDEIGHYPCQTFGLAPIRNENLKVIVCVTHKASCVQRHLVTRFPGTMVEGTDALNYIETSVLSPIKLLCNVSRSFSRTSKRLGHYVLDGNINTDYSYAYAGMVFHGTNGLQYHSDPSYRCKEKKKKKKEF